MDIQTDVIGGSKPRDVFILQLPGVAATECRQEKLFFFNTALENVKT